MDPQDPRQPQILLDFSLLGIVLALVGSASAPSHEGIVMPKIKPVHANFIAGA